MVLCQFTMDGQNVGGSASKGYKQPEYSSHNQAIQPAPDGHIIGISIPRVPRSSLSQDRWDELRPLIQRWYIQENRTIASISNLVRDSQGFAPT